MDKNVPVTDHDPGKFYVSAKSVLCFPEDVNNTSEIHQTEEQRYIVHRYMVKQRYNATWLNLERYKSVPSCRTDPH